MSKGPVSLPGSLKKRIDQTSETAQSSKPIPSLEAVREAFSPEGAVPKPSYKRRAPSASYGMKSGKNKGIAFLVSVEDYELLRQIGGEYGSPNKAARLLFAAALEAEKKKRAKS